ncbi:ABC transporter permease [Pseudothermotoga hypogea DSM 11164 = NBRC 106472]|uniref:ABC transporter permease n=1 Tax=Pseudothermotoga hypogea DSM 11164 = NBRC 106472 TaxID=1123384 RepID=A0A0X1KS53_9THEM|nr:ABC transporter permease [Pseudothermotoga hypogea DSM 11164 = NBRC 106472]
MIPALSLIFVFLILPGVWVLKIGMTNETLTGAKARNPDFVGFENYAKVLSDRFFYNALRITLLFVLGSAIIGQAGLGLSLALLTYRKRRLKSFVQSVVILAWIIPEVVVAYLWIAFLDKDYGTLNVLLSAIGLNKINWFYEYPLLTIIVFNVWRGTAYSMLLFSAALETIPPSYLETAEVIGASSWRKFKDVVFPNIKSYILTDLILITLWTFNVFTPYLLTGGGPSFRTELLSIYIYRTAFRYFKLGYGASIATIALLINFALAMFYLSLSRRRRA